MTGKTKKAANEAKRLHVCNCHPDYTDQDSKQICGEPGCAIRPTWIKNIFFWTWNIISIGTSQHAVIHIVNIVLY